MCCVALSLSLSHCCVVAYFFFFSLSLLSFAIHLLSFHCALHCISFSNPTVGKKNRARSKTTTRASRQAARAHLHPAESERRRDMRAGLVNAIIIIKRWRYGNGCKCSLATAKNTIQQQSSTTMGTWTTNGIRNIYKQQSKSSTTTEWCSSNNNSKKKALTE